MTNPVIAEVTRGGIVESRHRGAFAVVDQTGHVVAAEGAIAAAVYPRSAVKAFQCLPVIESGAADRFGFTEEEIALCCASHNGEPDHVRVARSMLAKAGNAEDLYECGAHWPYHEAAAPRPDPPGRALRSRSTTTAPASTPACWRWPGSSAPIPMAIRRPITRCSA